VKQGLRLGSVWFISAMFWLTGRKINPIFIAFSDRTSQATFIIQSGRVLFGQANFIVLVSGISPDKANFIVQSDRGSPDNATRV